MKKSLFRNIVIFGIISAVVMLVIVSAVMAYVYHSLMITSCETNAAACAKLINETYIGYGVDMEEFERFPLAQKRFREYVWTDCDYYDCKYVYLYRPGDEPGTRKYYFAVATDPEEDNELKLSRGFGTVVDKELRSVEQEVYNGTAPYGVAHTNNEFGRVYTWYYPVKDNSGKIIALCAIDFAAEAFYTRVISSSVYLLVPCLLLITLMLALIFLKLRKNIIIPLRQLSAKMDTYDPAAELVLSDIRQYGEIETITHSFNEMSDSIKNYIKDIKTLSDERAVASAELNIARNIQLGMVPENQSFDNGLVRIESYCRPAKEVGGDFYSFSQKGRYVCLVIGDVSGKGVAAAMFMSMTLSLVREKLHSGLKPSDALNEVNHTLCLENPEGMFVTVFAAVYDPYTGELVYANGGHTKPVLITSEASFIEPDPGIALGLFDDSDIHDDIIMLEPGDSVMLYTDGATDAVGDGKAFFGEAGILNSVDHDKGVENTKILAGNIRSFIGENSQFDDITILTLSRSRVASSSFTKVLEPEIEAFDEVKDELISMLGMNAKTKKIILACEEIFTNIADYSGTDKAGVICAREGDDLVVRFEDSGMEFDPLTSEMPHKAFEDYDTGGMGIMLVKRITNSIVYNRINGRNILSLGFNDLGSQA